MKRVTHKQAVDETLRILIVDRPGFNLQTQREALARVGRGVEYGDVEHWLRSIRPGDRAALAWLHLLAPAPGKSDRPLAAFNATYDRLMASQCIVIEAITGARSDDAKHWPAAVAHTRDVIRSGRHMTSREARKRSAKGKAARPLSAEDRWKAEPKLMRQATVIWRSREHKNDQAAWLAVNEWLESIDRAGMQFGSKETCRRVLLGRT
jgi:hypothetical protein